MAADVRDNAAEDMDLPDPIADDAVITTVLFSVCDQARTLVEIRQALKPQGRVVFLEHIGPEESAPLRPVQRSLRPLWGCTKVTAVTGLLPL